MRIRAIIMIFFLSLGLHAQDAQYSQYYNNPIYLNPAFTGTGEDTRVGLNYRSQWAGLDPAYKLSSLWSDFFFPKHNTSAGLLLRQDLNSGSKLRSTEIGVSTAYSINLAKGWAVRPGLLLSYASKDINYSYTIFGDGLNDDGSTSTSSDPLLDNSSRAGYVDVSAGLLAYSPNLWAGFSVFHLNTPNQAFGSATSSLPVRWSAHGGYKIVLQERSQAWGAPILETSLTPTFHYLSQGEYDQLDLGLYYRWDPFMAGFWYRGIPVKRYRLGYSNTEGLVFMGGAHYRGISFFYSYDLNLGQLRTISGGSHEISIQYSTLLHKKVKKRKTGFSIPCPNLEKRYKKTKIG